MSLAAMNQVAAGADVATRAGEFAVLARHFMAARGDLMTALHRAASTRSPRVEAALRSAVASGTLANTTPLSEYRLLVSSFLDSLANAGAFDRMLPDMRRIPLRTRTGLVTAGAAGSAVGDSGMTPISSLALANNVLDPVKASAIIAMSDDLARFAGPEGAALFASELRKAVAVATDREFLALVLAGISPASSAGTTVQSIWTDLSAAVSAVATDASSKLFILVGAPTAKSIALTAGNAGPPPFPNVTPQGGTIAGIPIIVTDAAAGSLIVLDASAIAAGSETLVLDSTKEADLQLATAPDSPPTGATLLNSLWQQNMVALRAERFFGAVLLRSSGAAAVTVSY